VADGSTDQTTDLTFIGKNYAGYGEIVNENLLKLLENFSNKTSPAKAILGQLWFDSANKRLKVRAGNIWNAFPYVEYATSQPKNLSNGDFWFNSSTNKLYVKNATESSGFTLIGPSVSANGSDSSSIVAVTKIIDTDNNTKTVFTHVLNSEIVMVVSSDEFNVKTTEPLYPLFPVIKKGITLSGTDRSTGVSSTNGSYFYGTAAHALRLGDNAADDFLLKSSFNSATTSPNGFNIPTDQGILVGISGVFRFHADSGQAEGKISAILGTKMSFNLRYPDISSTITNVLNISGNKLLPGYNLSTDIGSSDTGNQFANIYVTTVTSTLISSKNISATTGTFTLVSATTFTGNLTGDVSGNVKAAAVTSTNFYGIVNGNVNTTVISTGAAGTSGSITGKWTLTGSSTLQATYADLAERYHADDIYDQGTVLAIGGVNEVTISQFRGDYAVAGIVSTNPAYMLNSDAGSDDTHPYIALKGRVPCKVVGIIKKGDPLVTSQTPGHACAFSDQIDNPCAILAVALESYVGGSTGIIEVKVYTAIGAVIASWLV
jgi:hypothetical protein